MGSREFVQRNVSAWRGSTLKQGFNATDGFGGQENIAAHAADLGGNVIDYDYLSVEFDRVDDSPGFIFAGASLNHALHGRLLLFRDVTHLGGPGSDTVIKISSGCAVVQTM